MHTHFFISICLLFEKYNINIKKYHKHLKSVLLLIDLIISLITAFQFYGNCGQSRIYKAGGICNGPLFWTRIIKKLGEKIDVTTRIYVNTL